MRALLLAVCLSCAGYAAEPGLVAHWTFDQPGAVAADVSGQGHDAPVAGLLFVPSPRGHALRFDGVANQVVYAHPETMNLAGDLTLAVWVKTDSAVAPKTNRLIFGDTGLGVERNLNLRLDGYGLLRFEWADGVRNASLTAPADLLDGTWKHVVVVCDSTARRATMYVDAAPVSAMAMPLPISPAPVKERASGKFYNGCFAGDLDDLRLYARALRADEVRRLYEREAAVQLEGSRLVVDPRQPDRVALQRALANHGARPVTVRIDDGTRSWSTTVGPGGHTELPVGATTLTPLFRQRPGPRLVGPPSSRVTVATDLPGWTDTQTWTPRAPLSLEPLAVTVGDPWRREPAAPTRALHLELRHCFRDEVARACPVALTLRDAAGHAVWRQVVPLRAEVTPAEVDTHTLPWGAYTLRATLLDREGRELLSVDQPATLLPGGAQRIVVRNNLVSELMDTAARGVTGPVIAFMNPRDGWVWFARRGDERVRLDDEAEELFAGAPEAMRRLPAGRHVLRVSGRLTGLTARAIPALFFNVYPGTPQLDRYGTHTWERLKPRTLPNTNMIEAQRADLPEAAEWVGQHKSWILNRTAPGLDGPLTVEQCREAWHGAPGFGTPRLSGMQVDEYWGGWDPDKLMATVRSLAELAEEPEFADRQWIPFVVRMYETEAGRLFMRTVLAAGWPFSIEEYVGEVPGAAADEAELRTAYTAVAEGWEQALPGSLRRAIFAPMYAALPYCTTNRCPDGDFRVHLETQLRLLATEPAWFGLWGIQPYRSNYVDAELQDLTAALLRHYAIEGRTDRLLTDPYELRYVRNPDFAEGLAGWEVVPGEPGGVRAGRFAGYGGLEGRYPPLAYGDTFVVLKRAAVGPNRVRQTVTGLRPGRVYTLKAISADVTDLTAGRSRQVELPLTVTVEGAEPLPGGFTQPFRSARGPQPFTMQHPFWMTWHWQRFKATAPTATLTLSDEGAAPGQELGVNFLELQPALAP